MHRIRLRAQQAALRRAPQLFESRWSVKRDGGRWPDEFVAIDQRCPPDCGPVEDLLEDRFTFVGTTYDLGTPARWDPPGMSQLWLYHHHYWEWAWTLLRHEDRDEARAAFARQFSTWSDQVQFGRWNAWAPYPTSLRTWVLLNVARPLGQGTEIEARLHRALQIHAGFVARNLERDVGGNHLIKNLKALIGVAVWFDDSQMLRRGTTMLEAQLRHQVLPDGGHFELSPSYHCQVLADLIDLHQLLAGADLPQPQGIENAIERMRRWLGAMLMPDGDVPLFNDAERVGLARIAALAPSAPGDERLIVLRDSGYVIARTGRLHLVADVGQPCPPELPAHAQADCLTFELAIDGTRIIVDPGTSEYGSGPQRQWERSTAAHNTVTIDNEDQTEVWGAFRAGRRAPATLDEAALHGDTVTIIAHHRGYHWLPGEPEHHRTWIVTPRKLTITDEVRGSGRHLIARRLLFSSVDVHRAGTEVQGPSWNLSLGASGDGDLRVEPAQRAEGHGRLRPATAILQAVKADLPITMAFELGLYEGRTQ